MATKRLDESLSAERSLKNLTPGGDNGNEIDFSVIQISQSGQVQPASSPAEPTSGSSGSSGPSGGAPPKGKS